MKKIFIFFIVFATTITGCKQLDITPDGRFTMDDVFNDVIQTEAYLNTVYDYIPRYYVGYFEWSFLAGITDEAQDAENGNYGTLSFNWINGGLTPSQDPTANTGTDKNANTYVSCWTGINHANIFLNRISSSTILADQLKERYIAEATLLRAFYYWELIRKYGPMPIFDNPLPNDIDYAALVRPTFQECIDFIVRDCDAVIVNNELPLRITNEVQRTRVSKSMAYAVKSQALLFNASPLWNPDNDKVKWEASATASKQALDVLTSNGFELYSDYEEYFRTQKDYTASPRDKETIFERLSAFPNAIFSIPSRGGNWKLGACPSQELVDAYDMINGEPAITGYLDDDHLQPIINPASGYDPNEPYANRDPRFYATVWHNGAQWDNINGSVHTVETYVGGKDQLIKTPPNRLNTRTGYYLRKFVDPQVQPGQGNQTPSWKKYRLAEIYLNYAESENEANGPTQAYEAINTIRRRAGVKELPSGLSQSEMRERIRRERRVELAWEEHRFWDVRRWKILHETDKLVTGVEIKRQTGADTPVSVNNPGFENGGAGWTLDGNTIIDPNQGRSGQAVLGQDGRVYQTISGLKPNTGYSVSAWFRISSVDSGNGIGTVFSIREYAGTGTEVRDFVNQIGDWAQYTLQFTTGPANTTAEISSWWPAGSKGYIDDVTMLELDNTPAFSYERFVTERRQAWHEKYLIFPIPITDASIIPDFGLNQNPGW